MLFKKLVWEAINKDYPKWKQRKSARAKKSTSAKKAVTGRMGKGKEEENKKRLSSKINYDALEKLTDESEEVTEKAKKDVIDSNCGNQIETQQSKGTSNYSDELELDNANLYLYRDEEDGEYGYREDYDYEEF